MELDYIERKKTRWNITGKTKKTKIDKKRTQKNISIEQKRWSSKQGNNSKRASETLQWTINMKLYKIFHFDYD